jgi:hypothetical protein
MGLRVKNSIFEVKVDNSNAEQDYSKLLLDELPLPNGMAGNSSGRLAGGKPCGAVIPFR